LKIIKSFFRNRTSETSKLFLIVCLLQSLFSCQNKATLFEAVQADQSNISFANNLTESPAMNILAYEYFYNGGGLAAGDFNNDGLTDLYFSGNQVANKLYLNKGNLAFEEHKNPILEGKKNSWKTGVAIVDINQDGWLDIYQCYSGKGDEASRKNQLFVNQGFKGNKWNGEFIESAEAYGIADAGYTTQATFFDYDVDGDLDLFVLNHNLKNYERKEASFMKNAIDALAGDRLYQNENGHFKDVTTAAGIKSNPLGFGLGVVVSDFNKDNLPDLYVANDYVEEDYLYLNKGNGTFDEIGKAAMGHFSYSSMGVDAADFNNDALTDIFTADMLPEDNKRQKLLAFPDNWNVQQSMLDNGFHWQNMRNMLQLNNGQTTAFDGKKTQSFSEIGQLAGVSATDWSWSPLFADFDNDGFKDLFVSNGFVRDLTDLDFVKYFIDQETKAKQQQPSESLINMVQKMPSTPTHHFIYKNNGDLTFTDKVEDWGFAANTIASGSIYADLDNDGDLEIITNNTNQPATIYRNNSQEQAKKNFIKIKLDAASEGAKIYVFADGKTQYFENTATHGFQSSINTPIHVGLGDASKIDSIKIVWADNSFKKEVNPLINSVLKIEKSKSILFFAEKISPAIFEETQSIQHQQRENPNIDFNRQILLPKFYSRVNPHFAKADVNNDGLEDLLITTPLGQQTELYIQQKNGGFQKSNQKFKDANASVEDLHAVFFDADSDRDQDLLILSGGYEQQLESEVFQDRFFINDGKGNFKQDNSRIPKILTNKSTAKVADLDLDGDLDIVVAGSIRAALYPYSDPSFILQNDGKGHFLVAQKIEMDAISDFELIDCNNDKYLDLVTVGVFSPVQSFLNEKGKFSQKSEILVPTGWYNQILKSDLDNDGDFDLIVGNLGSNTALKASEKQALELQYGDPDENYSIDLILSNFYKNTQHPIYGRDEILEQTTFLRKKYTDYKSFSEAVTDNLLDENQKSKMKKMAIQNLKSGVLWNEKGKFEWHDLPTIVQNAPIYAIFSEDLNNDGQKDIILAGNEANFRIRIGKTDANRGIVLLGTKEKKFKYLPQYNSGLNLDGDVRSITKINKTYFFGITNQLLKSYVVH
jgi:enediyne biosynthesis protein E4